MSPAPSAHLRAPDSARLAEATGVFAMLSDVTRLHLLWLLAQGDDIVPIPGTRNRARAVENAAAASIALTHGDLETIRAALPNGGFGSRYPEPFMPKG